MPVTTAGRLVAGAAAVFIGAALVILSGSLPADVGNAVYFVLPVTWLAICCGLAGMALSRV
ncbi:hypothetical protein ACWT_8067 [Actinoplanes sp. SE50]|uniref:hypothetical protein n=1 Tax=unclassified Actinoplanes TaxID=2626549 RepID=UPI00023EDCBE|nr:MULTISPECIES: hypothetical protein [unclassified Actinoplanes]AEV89076.1 hypothetical protein ACPL_8198 [Actinoplanes sp. SE50/110]ATO87482.1 hypothetical protein ACWT_8067 [Actinoplanes sp. SE50]SLM04900.1 hypothetical protein ACSP50_8212 [Actinoplanes sp. SE50/110]